MANKQSDEGSSSTNILQPKFFKIIFSPRKCSRLTIPEAFASRYCKNMQTPAYLEVPSGQVWEVEVVHSEGQIWLTKGWQDFSDYYSIDCGHFLMFGYNGSSHFNVTIFDVSASEIGYPYDADRGTCCAPKRDQSDNSIEILEDIPRSHGAKGKYSDFVEGSVKTSGHIPLGHSSKRRKQERDAENDDSVDMQDVVSPSFTRNFQKVEYPDSAVHGTCHAPKRGQIESGDSIEILEDIPKSHRGKAKIHDMIARSAENLVHGPLGPSKRKRQGEDEDDISVDMLTKRMDVEKSQEDVASPSFTKKGRKGSEGCMKHKQKNKTVHNANKRVMNKERAISYQRARAFKSKNPFIISFMQPSYVNSPFNLSVPLKFAKKHFLENYGDLVLRVRGRGSWSVKCTPSTINAKIRSGWKAFVLDNKLKLGDACVFEVIKGTKLIDVTIFPAAGSKSMHNIGGGEVPGVTDSENKIDKTDVSVPRSQSKVVLTNKLKLPTGGSYGFNSKIKESCRAHEQQSRVVSDKSKTVMNKERTIAYQRAKAFQSKNPFIVSFMQPSYLSIPYILNISSAFALKYLLEDCGDLVLRVIGRGSWSVRCSIGTADAKIHSGWKAFVLDNKLKIGDVCVFEVIKGTDQLFIDVTIFRAAESTSMHETNGQVSGVYVCKNKIIETEDSDPCARPR